MTTATTIAILTLALLSIFQVALSLGAPLGQFAWGGQHRTLPRNLRIGSLFSLLIYFGIAVCLLSKSGAYQFIPQGRLLDTLIWSIFAYFTIGIFMNAISRSKRERYVMTPIAATLAMCVFILS